MKETKLFYFSGTGNSFRIAKSLSEKMQNVQLIQMSMTKRYHFEPDDTVGFVFPIYFFGLPKIVVDFLQRCSFSKNTYVFVVATRGVQLGGGIRKQTLAELKGHLSYFKYITMGDNFNLAFWEVSSPKVKIDRNIKSDITVNEVARDVKDRIERYDDSIADRLWVLGQRAPKYGYKNYLELDDQHFSIDTSQCNHCGKCIRKCPVKNMKITENQGVMWLHINCQLCLACFHCCPQNAIQYENKIFSTRSKKQYWNYE